MAVVGITVAVSIAAASAGCMDPGTSYFPTGGSTEVAVPITRLEQVYIGIDLLEASGSDQVELLSLEAEGLHGGARVEGIASALGASTTWIGSGTRINVESHGIDLGTYRPVAGMRFTSGDGRVALVIRMLGDAPSFGFERIRLTFRIDGGPAQSQVFEIAGRVCVDPAYPDAVDACNLPPAP